VAAQQSLHRAVCALVPPDAPAPELVFLEITTPLLADRLAELATQPPGRVTVFPFFLVRGGHAGEEVPEIVEHHLAGTGWQATVIEPVGWPAVLGGNAARRLALWGVEPGTPVIVSGYGAKRHEAAWHELVAAIESHAGEWGGGEWPWTFAPSGHYLADPTAPLRAAITPHHAAGRRVAILPLYLGVSSYQHQLIPAVLSGFPGLRASFIPDGILPDASIARWVAEGAGLISR
jgi:sirohydrochlorin ferrochelatase